MYKLTESLPFTLYTITNHITGAFSAELAEDGLTIAMYRIMAALVEREDQRLGELGEMIFIEITSLSRLVGTMSRRGLVTRHRQESDERSLRINLTPQGHSLLQRLIPRASYYETLAIQGIDKDKIHLLAATLSEILANVSEAKATIIVERRSSASRVPRSSALKRNAS